MVPSLGTYRVPYRSSMFIRGYRSLVWDGVSTWDSTPYTFPSCQGTGKPRAQVGTKAFFMKMLKEEGPRTSQTQIQHGVMLTFQEYGPVSEFKEK